MKMFEHGEFNSEITNQEPAPSDATYNFGSSAATGLGVKVTTYVASALALGGSLFISNQLLTPPNLKSADQANAASQPNGSTGNSANSSVSLGRNGDGSSTTGASGDEGLSVPALSTSKFGSTSTGNGRLATTPADPAAANGSNTTAPNSAPTVDPTTAPTVDPAPAPSTQPVVVLPPPTFNHSNTSSATPGASTGSAGSGSNRSGSNYGGENENEGDDH